MLIHQIRYTLRTLRRTPGFTAMAIVTVALGVGANTAVFSVVDSVLLRPLPYAHPDRLVRVAEVPVALPGSAGRDGVAATSLQTYRLAQSFEGLAGYNRMSRSLTGSGDPVQVRGEEVTTNLFALLGASAAIGRVFDPDEDDPGGRRVVILTDAFWRAKFGGDRAILGRPLTFNGEPYDVIGVMPPGFRPLSEHRSGYTIDFFMPAAFDQLAASASGRRRSISVVGRLKPEASIAQAREELRSLAEDLSRRDADTHRGLTAALEPLHDAIVGDVRPSLLVMLGAVGLVLVIACVNLANLLIVRAIGQRREVAIRMAIGATRAQITIDLALRGLILGVLGGAAGLVCGVWTRNVLASLAPITMPRMDGVALNPRVLAVTFALAAITGIVAGLLPAVQLWRGDAAPTLRASALTTSGVRSMARWRGLLMAAEIAAALTLAVGAGLLVRSLMRLAAVDLGFEAQDVLLFTVNPPDTKYRDEAARVALFEEIERRVASIPGVASAAVANEFPLRGGGQSRVTIAGDAATGGESVRRAGFQAVSPGYFATLRIPLVRGRLLAAWDRAGAPPAVVVSETFARRFLAGRDPIGQRFRESQTGIDSPELTIVGVVRDTRRDGPGADLTPQVYLSAAQPDTYRERTHLFEVAVRAAGTDPHALLPAIQRAVWSIDPAQPIMSVLTLDEVIAGSTAERRFNMTLLSAVALLAFGLAIVGVYGVVAYAAAQRTREIGIRIALGAGRHHVLSLVIASGLRWALLGIVVGLAGAYAGTRFLAALLFGITPTDLGTFAGLAALMLAVAALASYAPAHRAASVNPVSALRGD
jgi:putative ABC transport system permease protein